MSRFIIKSADGRSVRFRGCPVYHGTYLKPSYLEFREVASDSPIDWTPGDYVDYSRTGIRYLLYDLPECVQNSEKAGVAERYVYSNVRLYARTKDLERCVFRDLVAADNTIHFSSRKTISTFEALDGVARRIQACLDADYPGDWTVRIDSDLAASEPSVSEARELSVESGETILSVLDKVYSLWENVGWTYFYDLSAGRHVLSLGGANTRRADNTVAGGSIGRGSGLTSMKVTFSKMDDVCTRLYPFGSTRNMRARYYNSLGIKDAESVDIPNLMIPVSEWGVTDGLPDPRKAFLRVASEAAERLLGERRKVVYFDDETYGEIYPSIEGVTIGNIRGAMSASDEYYPSAAEYADSDRADEVRSASTASLDDGTGAAGAVTQKVLPSLDSAMTGSVGVAGSLTLAKDIGSAVMTMGRWSDILFGNGQARILVTADRGVAVNGAFLTVECMGNEARIDLETSYDTNADRYSLLVPDGCSLSHEGFFSVSDFSAGDQFTLHLSLTVEASGSKYLQDSNVTVSQDNSDPIAVSLRDGSPTTASLKIRQIGFDMNSQRMTSGSRVGTLEMKTGACAGRSFRIDRCVYSSSDDSWSLRIRRVTDRSLNMTFPNATYQIKAGDRFVITDIRMPDRYIEYASQRLLARAEEVLEELSRPIAVLTPSVDAKFVREADRTLMEGRFLGCDASVLSQGYLSIGAYSDLIDTITINEGDEAIPTYSVTLRERPRKSFKMESDSSASGSTEESGESSGTSSSSSKGDKGDPGKDGTGIKTVEQTTESEVSGGENVVTVTLTDGTASSFKVRNGAKGRDGEPGASGMDGVSAGFGTPSASAFALPAGSLPTAEIDASGSNKAKVFSFTFGIPSGAPGAAGSPGESAYEIAVASGFEGSEDEWLASLKGQKGDSGAPGKDGSSAGFGTPSASVSSLPAGSTPTVSVMASGPDSAKTFRFTFGIPLAQGAGDDSMARLRTRPSLAIQRGATGDEVGISSLVIRHPLLSSPSYEAVLMSYRRHNCSRTGTDSSGHTLRMSRKGWAVALGNLVVTGHDPLVSRGAAGSGGEARINLTDLRDFMVKRFMTDKNHTPAELFSRTYSQWAAESNSDRGFGDSRKARRRFGIAVRYINPEFQALASGTAGNTTMELVSGSGAKVPRYIYSDVAPVDAVLISKGTERLRSELWFGLV